MKLLKILCFFLTLFYCISISAETLKRKKKKTIEPTFNYVSELRKVDSLINQVNQPKTAQDVLNNILQRAMAEKQNGYYIKCIQYQVMLNNSGLESDDTSAVNWKLMNVEIAKGSDDIKAFLSMDAAGYLKAVYEQYRWQYDKIPDDKSTNPNNWSTEKLNDFINLHINDALKFSERIEYNPIYEPLIIHFKDYDFKLGIQQVLMRSAIDILENLEIPYNADYEMPKVEDALAPFNVFLDSKFSNPDDPKNENKRLILYQRFLNSIANSNDEGKMNALIFFDIERLNRLKNEYSGQETFYLKAMEYLFHANISNPYSNLAAYQLADYYQNDEPVKAMAIINEAIVRHPGFKNEKLLLFIKKSLESPVLSVHIEDLNQPGRKLLSKLSYANLKKVYITAYKIDKIDYLRQTSYEYNVNTPSTFQYLKSQTPFSKTYDMDLPLYTDYKSHSAEVALDSLPSGTYILVVSSTEKGLDSTAKSVYGLICVAPYTIVKNGKDIYLLSALNGMPVVNEPYRVYADNLYRYGNTSKLRYEELYSGRTSGQGLIDLSAVKITNENRNITIETGNKILYQSDYILPFNIGNSNDNSDIVTFKTITDRSIYRPGQLVYFKCIAYDYQKKKIVSGKKIEIILKDNNGEEKGKLSLITNSYGSASGTFVLPKGGFNTGDFSLSVNENYGVSFRVEEYKRPKYSARFLVPEKAYKLNDEVTVVAEAKAFAGYPVQDAKVSYNISRRLKNNWTYYRPVIWTNGSNVTLLSGNTVTDKDGKFNVSFKALPDVNQDSKTNPYFIFEIAATITDLNGEIKTCNYSLTMAYTDQQISIGGDIDNAVGQPLTLNYACTNLQDKPLPFSGSIAIEKVNENKMPMRSRLWEAADTTTISEKDFYAWFPMFEYSAKEPGRHMILNRTFVNDTKASLVLLPSELREIGTYRATITSMDSRGETLTSFCLFKLIPNKPGPFILADALNIQCLNGSQFEPKSKAKILLSSGAKNARIHISFKSNRGMLLEKEINLNQSSEMIEIPVVEADRGNIQMNAYMVNDYRLYTAAKVINVPYSNKELSIKLSSFRDETEPGSKEKWIVKLKGPASEKAAMESVAVLYDQSLDAIYDNAGWPMRIFDSYYRYDNTIANFGSNEFLELTETENAYDYLDEEAYYQFRIPAYRANLSLVDGYEGGTYMWHFGGGAGAAAMPGENDEDVIEKKMELGNVSLRHAYSSNDNIGFTSKEDIKPGSTSNPEKISAVNNSMRKSFNETAFFYPHLVAGKNGEISLEFTMPEALTQWKMRMLSHSTTMQTGYLEHSITTSKKVMVQPNVPRFLRQGDAITIASKIINTTSKPIAAKANFTLMDETTGLPLKWLSDNNEKTINVPANSSSPISFSIKIPDFTGVVTLAISATAGTFSDGEQHTVPVLSNRTLITESMPITVRNSGTQNLEFTHLKNNTSTTLTHENLSVEISSNPAWYAIQALPYMMEFPHECAEQIFTRLYANSIAVHLANSNPEIKKIYASWERQAATGNGLQSKLQQNQELKNTLIEETPWLYEAKNETERMRKLGVLFNQEKMNEELQTAFEKLKQMQSENGAFGWFKGMNDNSYITQTIVIGFGKMQRMGVDISIYSDMIERAMFFLDGEAKRDFKYYRSLKAYKNFYPHNLQYLYCKSYFPQVGLNVKDSIVEYFVVNSEKNWVENSMLNKAQLATALKVLKPESKVTEQIIRSFSENAKQSNEMGMYWPVNKSGYYWFDAPVETQAAVIEAYSAVANDAGILKEQQIWLLRQKQTQNWSTTRSTADACYALLMHGNFLNSKQEVSVSLNNVKVKPEKTEEGTGYYRQNLPKESITPKSGDIQVIASTSDFAYGAVYWQYFEQMDKIQSTGSGLHIEKKIFKIVNTASGIAKVEVLNGELNTGDMVEVSLSISCDRNLEFVHVKDLRGSGTEPVDALSEFHWQNGLGYYQSTKDVATHFFIDNLPKGIYQLNYKLKVEQAGTYNSGIASIQCMYAPEYTANSTGKILNVK